ncbi:hypothetical protein NC651_018391 [Populus alba x Populus x berolinensis]|nr:hypothetical protein NC651_018391 [Populus alba x Populus x berolinensis]
MLRCFTSKVEGSQRTEIKYFNKVDDVRISNEDVLEFNIDDLDLFYDDVDDVVVGRNFNYDSLGNERTERVILILVGCMIRVVINKQMMRRRKHMMIILLLIRKDMNLLTNKKINGLLA